jgi:predicted GNAT family acetyltransferase
MDIVDNAAASRYETHVGDEVAFVDYKKHDGVIVFTHAEVPQDLEGHGLAGHLAKRALDDARANGLRVVPRCPFIASYIERHPEYGDLVWKAADSSRTPGA